jgi:transglutaminase-like putative cysteine protease
MTSTSPPANLMKHSLIRRLSVVICVALIAISLFGAYLWIPAKIHYHIIEQHTITIPTKQADLRIGFIVPSSGPYQVVKNVKVDWPGEIEKSTFTYVDAYKMYGEAQEGQALVAIITYDAILPQGTAKWEAPVSKTQTLPQIGIESDHPSISETAAGLSNDAYKIFRFISQHLDYSEINCEETSISALEALRSRTGSCLGYSRLLVALYRAAGIPAQMIIGTMLPDDYFSLPQTSSSVFPGQGHAWVEFFVQDRWSLVDPTWGQGIAARLEFKRNDGRHLSYGEYDQFMEAHKDLSRWVSQYPFQLDYELTHQISSDIEIVTTESEINVIKTWDGRWLNVLIVFGIVTFILCKIRDRLFTMQDG